MKTQSWFAFGWMALGMTLFGWVAGVVKAQEDWRREARQYGWLLNLPEAFRVAQQTNRPLMVVIRCIP
ncbi:MAG: hypothetical protein KatS3mg110_2826 [Pirellulaceae bacterium]|nr:MAG: hypothetical protein KatS3mg110_2826 [Pirellulaceae bacterium]